MQSLSAVIITYNEEKNIADCIRSVHELATEIIVLDSFSSDRTCEIAKAEGAVVHQHAFDGHIQQKNRARLLASADWIISLDADERVSPELSASIKYALSNPQCSGYTMNRLNHIGTRAVRTCGWYPDRKLRLWKRELGEWTGINPHDRFELPANTAVCHLIGDLLHYTYSDTAAMKKQVNKFARIAAEQFKGKSTLWLIYKLCFSGIFKFIRTYLLELGFAEGKLGLSICTQQSREVFLKYYLALKPATQYGA